MAHSKTALQFQHVSKVYPNNGRGRFALRDVSFSVEPGKTVAIVGRSGSGKSTLLHLSAGIDVPSQGDILVEDSNLAELSEKARTLLRRHKIGLVFQFFYLLPHLSVRDNVALPEFIAGNPAAEFEERIRSLLGKVDLLDRARDSVQKLSGGEMQRVAICRALLRKPRLLLADEPTGSLDDENSRSVMDLMIRLVSEEGSTLLYVTHSPNLAEKADSVWELHSGVLES